MATRLNHILAAILTAAALLPVNPADARGIPVDGYAAVVNNRVITVGRSPAQIQPVRMQIETAYEGEELEQKLAEAYDAALRSLIERALIIEAFARAGGSVPDRLVEDQVSSFISERFNNNRAAFLEALTEERMTIEDWREETRNRLIVSIMRRREVSDRVVISPRAVRDLYERNEEKYRTPEQVKLRMIMLQRGTSEEEQTVKRAEALKIRERLLAGDDFAELARTESEGARATQGGDFGWIEPGSLRPELAAVAAQIEAGRVSDIIETESELYILKVEARKKAAVMPFDDVRGEIEADLRRQEEDRLYAAWMDRLYRRFYVRILEDGQYTL